MPDLVIAAEPGFVAFCLPWGSTTKQIVEPTFIKLPVIAWRLSPAGDVVAITPAGNDIYVEAWQTPHGDIFGGDDSRYRLASEAELIGHVKNRWQHFRKIRLAHSGS